MKGNYPAKHSEQNVFLLFTIMEVFVPLFYVSFHN